MKKIFSWLIDKWLAGFITASLFFILKLYIDLPTESKSKFLSFTWIRDLMETQVSLLTVIIISIIIIILSQIDKYVHKQKYSSVDDLYSSPINQAENYREDVIGVNKNKWTWNYKWSYMDQSFLIIDLKPACPKCGTPMDNTDRYSPHSFECFKCKLEGEIFHYSVREDTSDVCKEIIRRIKSR